MKLFLPVHMCQFPYRSSVYLHMENCWQLIIFRKLPFFWYQQKGQVITGAGSLDLGGLSCPQACADFPLIDERIRYGTQLYNFTVQHVNSDINYSNWWYQFIHFNVHHCVLPSSCSINRNCHLLINVFICIKEKRVRLTYRRK